MLNKVKVSKTLGRDQLQKKTLIEWDDKGLKISNVSNMELRFGIHIITHKVYSSSRLNSVPHEALDLAYKVFKKNFEFDLVDLMLKQLNNNMESITTPKNNLDVNSVLC